MKSNNDETIKIWSITAQCVYTLLTYIKQQHCQSSIHTTNLKYFDAQQQICISSSRIEHNFLHNNIDEEVNQLVDEDVGSNII